MAAFVGNENMVRLLLKKGVNIEDDFYGYSALHAAAISDGEIFFLEKQGQNRKIIRLLVGMGANINQRRDDNYYTPLHSVVQKDEIKISQKIQIIHLLIELGANTKCKNAEGDTVLECPLRKNYHNVFKIIVYHQ